MKANFKSIIALVALVLVFVLAATLLSGVGGDKDQYEYSDLVFELKNSLVREFTIDGDTITVRVPEYIVTKDADGVDIINIKVAPYSNMVLGEVYARQGRWWSYIPHHHPQPEVYYYKFDRPEGFGACFIGDKAYTIKDCSVGMFPGGKSHAQVTAPGYPMYCAWMIRHLPGDPWNNTRTDLPEYAWLLEEK